MTWKFSDGTVAHLGGEIEGASYFAQLLREQIASGEAGVSLWPPTSGVDLDVNDVAIFDAWLRQELAVPARKWMMVELTEAPKDIPKLPPPPWGDEADDRATDLLY